MCSIHNFYSRISPHLFPCIKSEPYHDPLSLSRVALARTIRPCETNSGHQHKAPTNSFLSERKRHTVSAVCVNGNIWLSPEQIIVSFSTLALSFCVCSIHSRYDFTYNSPCVFVLWNKALGQWYIVSMPKCVHASVYVFYKHPNVIVWSYCDQ